MNQIYLDAGLDLAQINGTEKAILPLPAIYVLRPDGVIWSHWLALDYTNRVDPFVVLEALREEKADEKWRAEHPDIIEEHEKKQSEAAGAAESGTGTDTGK